MYSKFGKIIAERFQILNHRDEILSGQVKKIRPSSIIIRQQPKPDSSDTTEDQDYIESPKEPESSKPKPPTTTLSFKAQSREEFYKSTDKKIVSPPCGHYDCKYSLVYKSVKVPKFKPAPITRPRRRNNKSISQLSAAEDKPRTKQISPRPPFELQSARRNITSMIKDVNEKRFLKFEDMPKHNSKYKRVSTPDMSKSSKRRPLFKVNEHSPDYKPSFKLVASDLGKVTLFEKYSPRKHEGGSYENDLRQYNPKYSLVEKKICAPDFNKSTSRPKSATPLPCFMKSVNWRGAIDVMNEKSLEMNYYIDKDSIYNSIMQD